jgi:eukaryotic-like serine/threonine-protein kinase
MSRIATQVSLTTLGGYQILEKIGDGGMGTVYKALDQAMHRFVAIKVIPAEVVADPVLRMRFAQECQVARKLDHPHAVKVLDFGLDGSKPYLVMEYVDGETVGNRLEREGRIAEAEAVRLIAQVGDALHCAHQRRLIHRDVKPDNILITVDGQAKLTDLGLAKNLEGDLNLTQTLSCLGTPNFMAPEQFEDARRADARSDLYSLAATLYMMVTGELPFRARSARAVGTIYKKKMANDLAPPRQLVPELSAQLESQILRAMHVDRDERHASVLEFLECLPVETTVSVPATPEPVPETPAQAAQRRRRTKERYPSQHGTRCRPLQRSPDTSWEGQVVNVSQGGVCLELNRRFEPGTWLTIVLDGQKTSHCTLVVRVIWVQKDSPKHWKIGCQFDHPLCEFELQELR